MNYRDLKVSICPCPRSWGFFIAFYLRTSHHLGQELSILHKNSSVFFMQFTIFTLQ